MDISPIWTRGWSLVGFAIGDNRSLYQSLDSRLSAADAIQRVVELRERSPDFRLFAALNLSQWIELMRISEQSDNCSSLFNFKEDVDIFTPPCELLMPFGERNLHLTKFLSSHRVHCHLDGFVLQDKCIALASQMHGVIMASDSFSAVALSNIAEKFTRAGKRVIITEIDSPNHKATLAKSTLFSGPGLTCIDRLNFDPPMKLDGHSSKALRILGQLFNGDDLVDVESTLSSDPALAFRLISLVNSAAMRRGEDGAKSVREALLICGHARLCDWLCSLALSPSIGSKIDPSALRWNCLYRAKCAENMAKSNGHIDIASSAYVCSIISDLPPLIGMDVSDLLACCLLPAPMERAILFNEGPLGSLLKDRPSVAKTSFDTRTKPTTNACSDIDSLSSFQWSLSNL